MLVSDLSALPNFRLEAKDEVSQQISAKGLPTFHSLAAWIQALPYARNSDRSDFRLVVSEQKGTCSTKHALLAHVADQHREPVVLTLGIYEMTAGNTPGVGRILERHGLTSLPEAHCYLVSGLHRIDLTSASMAATIDHFLLEEEIEPRQIGDYKIQRHRSHLREWAADRRIALGVQELWRVREECILALSMGKTPAAGSNA